MPSIRQTTYRVSWELADPDNFQVDGPEFVLVDRGWSYLDLSGCKIKAQEGDILFLQQGDTLRRTGLGSKTITLIRVMGMVDCTLTKSEGDCLAWIAHKNFHHLPGSAAEKSGAAHLIQALASENDLSEPLDFQLKALLAKVFVSICERQVGKHTDVSPKKVEPHRKARLQRVLDFINGHLSEDFDWAAQAQKLGYSQQYFQKYFRKTMGISIAQYVLEARIRQAKAQIVSSDLTISEICYQVGFNSISAFNAAFRKATSSYPRYVRACDRQGLKIEQQARNLENQAREEVQREWMKPYQLANHTVSNDWHLINLTPYFNRPTRKSSDGLAFFGGLMSFDFLPIGELKLHGIPFQLPEERVVQNTCLIFQSSVMRGSVKKKLPTRVTIPLPVRLRSLYFLHGCAWGRDSNPFASYSLHYKNGLDYCVPVSSFGVPPRDSSPDSVARQCAPLIQDWWPCYHHCLHPSARPVVVRDPFDTATIRYVYTAEISNPYPNADLESLIIESNPKREPTLAILAVTALI